MFSWSSNITSWFYVVRIKTALIGILYLSRTFQDMSCEGETTSTTAAPLPPPVLLHKEEEYEYYKVRKSSFKLKQIMKTIDTMNDAQFVAL